MKNILNQKILLVDDQPGSLFALETVLKPFEVEIYKASSGDEALALTLKHSFAVVLLDVQMPIMDGFETAAFIRENDETKNVPIIFVTAINQDDEFVFKGYEAGAVDYLFKPINPVILKTKVDLFLRLDRQQILLKTEIDERKWAQRELKRLADFPEKNAHTVLEYDFETGVTYINPSGRMFFPDLIEGITKHEVLNGLKEQVDQIRDEKHELSVTEVEIGESIYEKTVNVVEDSNLIHVYLVDITRRKQLEELKDEFIGTVSHELRTPLTIIKGAVCNLRDGTVGELNEKQQRMVELGHSNVNRLERIINNLLDLSRLESDRSKLNRTDLPLYELIQETVDSFKDLAEKSGLKFTFKKISSIPNAYADGDMIVQVITNLVNNAMRYAKKEIDVKICIVNKIEGRELEKGKRQLQVYVHDDGEGIPKERIGDLFNKFVQLNRKAGVSSYKGTGLGLSISKAIIDRHQGKIWAESKPGEGTKFIFTLPEYNEDNHFNNIMSSTLGQAKERNLQVSAITISLDHLDISPSQRRVVMQRIIKTIQDDVLRQNDQLFYRKKESFILVLAETDWTGSVSIAMRIQNKVHQLFEGEVAESLNLGLAIYPDDADTAKKLISKAIERKQTKHKKKVLIIDDEEDLMNILSAFLSARDFEVQAAMDGYQGMAEIERFKPDIIVLDILMPGMDGWEVCEQIRANEATKDIPIVIYTALNDRDLEKKALKYNVTQVIHKPYSNHKFISLLSDFFAEA
jgi:signal transduction histidine kinase